MTMNKPDSALYSGSAKGTRGRADIPTARQAQGYREYNEMRGPSYKHLQSDSWMNVFRHLLGFGG